ncbi:MAG: heavy metal-responsive transcriptional regulator [Armatimonadetes bacterium]|nr:heavy metal-responsive transcriptional regulator [Armatimonadota bacterium]
MRIGELANRTGIPAKTIRYYEQIGILPKTPRTAAGYRVYDEDAVDRLEFVRKAKDLGLTLVDIHEILDVRDHGASPCPYVVHLLDRKIEELTGRLAGMQALRNDLRAVRRTVSSLPPAEIAARARFCHIIENRTLKLPQRSSRRPNPARSQPA